MVYTVSIDDFERLGERSTSVYVLEALNAEEAQANAVERYCTEAERHDRADYAFTTRPRVTYCVLGAPEHRADRDGAACTDSRTADRR
jgi:hypothetical protein